MRYHVFIEGARDPSPGGLERLAASLGQRYGMSVTAVIQRLSTGRFCARASLDHAAATQLAGDLATLGARCTVEQDRSTMQAAPPPVPGGARPPAAPSAPATAPTMEFASGLAAAYSGQRESADVQLDLGALGGASAETPSWQLARIDGSEDERTAVAPARVEAALAAERAQAAGASGPGAGAAPGPAVPPPPAVDPFMPPEMGREQQQALELGERRTTGGTVAQQAAPAHSPGAAAAGGGGTNVSAGAAGGYTGGGAPLASAFNELRTRRATGPWSGGSATLHREPLLSRLRHNLSDSLRARFFAGVAVAFVLGFIPAQIYVSARGHSAYDEIRADLEKQYGAADTPDAWDSLDTAVSDARDLVATRRQRLAIGGCLIWLVIAGGVALVWFRVIDWESSVPRLAPADHPSPSPSPAASLERRRSTR